MTDDRRTSPQPRRDEDTRYAVLERVVSKHVEWFSEMQVGPASEDERRAFIHVMRWWVRGQETKKERRKFYAAIASVATVVGTLSGAIAAIIGSHVVGH